MNKSFIQLLPIFTLFLVGCSGLIETTQPSPILRTAGITTSSSQTLTPTATMTNTPNPTPWPTFSQEEAVQEITELMQTNAGCTQPCFWGINPNLNSFYEAQNFFDKFGGDWETGKSGLLNYHSPEIRFHKENMNIGIVLYEKGGDFRKMEVDLYGLDEINITNQDWLAFRPESILRAYGPPTYIRIFLGMGPTLPGQELKVGYTMIFIYEQQHFVVRYESVDMVTVINSKAHICPLNKNKLTHFRLWIGKDPVDLEEGGPELKEGISMTNSEFYDLLLGDPTRACFDANFNAYFK